MKSLTGRPKGFGIICTDSDRTRDNLHVRMCSLKIIKTKCLIWDLGKFCYEVWLWFILVSFSVLNFYQDFLPDGYDYKICDFEEKQRNQFKAVVRLPLSCREDVEKWFALLQTKSCTTWRVDRTYRSNTTEGTRRKNDYRVSNRSVQLKCDSHKMINKKKPLYLSKHMW